MTGQVRGCDDACGNDECWDLQGMLERVMGVGVCFDHIRDTFTWKHKITMNSRKSQGSPVGRFSSAYIAHEREGIWHMRHYLHECIVYMRRVQKLALEISGYLLLQISICIYSVMASMFEFGPYQCHTNERQIPMTNCTYWRDATIKSM